jgi:hypothetical protein
LKALVAVMERGRRPDPGLEPDQDLEPEPEPDEPEPEPVSETKAQQIAVLQKQVADKDKELVARQALAANLKHDEPEPEALAPMERFDEAAVQRWLGTVPGLAAAQLAAAREEMAEDEYEAGVLTQGGQGGRPAPLASRLHRIPTHFLL